MTPMKNDSGMNVIKARLGNQVRKAPVYNAEMTYNELVLMLQRVFKGVIVKSDAVSIKYVDDDGDYVMLDDDDDLQLAMQMHTHLNLVVNVNDAASITSSEAAKYRAEWLSLRGQMDVLVEKMTTGGECGDDHSSSENLTTTAPISQVSEKPVEASEFDPLHTSMEKKIVENGQDAQQPPSVYGMGAAPPMAPPATIQPSMQQQVAPPTSQPQAPVAPQPFNPVAANFPPSAPMPTDMNRSASIDPPQPYMPPSSLPPTPAPSDAAATPPQQQQFNHPPAPGQQMQQPQQQQQYQALPPQQQQMMPPSSTPQSMYGQAAAQPPSGVPPPPAMAAPPMMPPQGMPAGGGNPFARAGTGVRQPYAQPPQQQQPQQPPQQQVQDPSRSMPPQQQHAYQQQPPQQFQQQPYGMQQ